MKIRTRFIANKFFLRSCVTLDLMTKNIPEEFYDFTYEMEIDTSMNHLTMNPLVLEELLDEIDFVF